MGGGRWSKWGRSTGYSLEIGNAYVGQVVPRPTPWDIRFYRATINGKMIGEYFTVEEAKNQVEQDIIGDMQLVLYHWEKLQNRKKKISVGEPCSVDSEWQSYGVAMTVTHSSTKWKPANERAFEVYLALSCTVFFPKARFSFTE